MSPSELQDAVAAQVQRAVRRVLNHLDRDPHSPTHGCFDRRFWGWKLVDMPEATYQRHIGVLAVLLREPTLPAAVAPEAELGAAVASGLRFAARIQHRNGAFDQAMPNEFSFGATAFLLDPLIDARELVIERPDLFGEAAGDLASADDMLYRAADFLCRHDEAHGHIANHLAGAALALDRAAALLGEPRFGARAESLLARVLERQSDEGWFLEYDGADPGYQTLCLYYLARLRQRQAAWPLAEPLRRAVEFLTWFAHPDGTFGGEYGSRRTALCYPGGLALLASEMPAAAALLRVTWRAAAMGVSVGLDEIDEGNLAPLLANWLLALAHPRGDADDHASYVLPFERDRAVRTFPDAGLVARGTAAYYAVLGVSNGGVLKVFDRTHHRLAYDDGGYVCRTEAGRWWTTQMTGGAQVLPADEDADEVEIEAPFYVMLRAVPSPWRMLVLRAMSLTLFRSVRAGNAVKALLVRLLMGGRRRAPLALRRRVRFGVDVVRVEDEVQVTGRLPRLAWLEHGRPFVAIHMASARYREPGRRMAGLLPAPRRLSVDALAQERVVSDRVVVAL